MSSIKQYKKDGPWLISYYFGVNEKGKHIGKLKKNRRSLKVESKREALTKQKHYDDLIKEGVDPDSVYKKDSSQNDNMMPRTVGELVDDFLKNIDENYNVNKTTKKRLGQYLNSLLLSNPKSKIKHGGLLKRDEPLENITVDRAKKIYTKLKEHYSPNSCVLFASYFRWLFNYAEEEGYIKKNPFYSDKRKNRTFPKGKKTKPHIFSAKEIEMMMDDSKDNPFLHDFILLALKTGMRREELYNLNWRDHVNFDARQLEFSGKGDKERTVPLPDDAFNMLENRYDKIKVIPIDSDQRVFHEIKNINTIYKHFVPMIRGLGIKAKFHDLRHTYGTRYIKNGGNAKILQEILGHSDLQTTMIYITLAADDLHQNINALTKFA